MQNCKKFIANKYDKLIILFISLQAFGLIGGAFRPVRLLAYCCFPFVITYFLTHRKAAKHYKYEVFFFIFWFFYAIISLIWVIDFRAGILYLYHLVASICTFFTLFWLAEKANKPQGSILKGWILLFILTLPIALFELTFDWHLPMSVQEESETIMSAGVVFYRRFASVTFGNLNTYNLVLCYILPFLLLAIIRSSKKGALFVYLLLLLSLIYIIVLNSSRAAVLALVLGLMLLLMYYIRNRKNRILIIVFIFVTVYFVSRNFESLFQIILLRFEISGFEDSIRFLFLDYTWDALINSNLFGVGVGNMSPVLASVYNMTVTVVHNLFLEIVLQYGVIIFLGFIFLLWRAIRKGMMSSDRSKRWFMLLALSIFITSSVIDASYLPKVYVWLFIGSLSVVVDKRYA